MLQKNQLWMGEGVPNDSSCLLCTLIILSAMRSMLDLVPSSFTEAKALHDFFLGYAKLRRPWAICAWESESTYREDIVHVPTTMQVGCGLWT